MKVSSAKAKVSEGYSTVKVALENLENLWLSIALGVSAYYNYNTINGNESPFEYYVRVASSSTIAIAAGWLFWKHVKRGN